jgi:hypothetical protein
VIKSKENVVAQGYELCFILEGKMGLYIQHGAKLIVNQLGCLYRHFGANSDEAACFLICTSLISQQKMKCSLDIDNMQK